MCQGDEVGEVAVKLPRYKSLAAELQEEIQSGRYGVGDHLPPEMELCQTYSVSRHTMRDALRLLREAGLVERRRGSGTTVLAHEPRPVFVQPLGGMDELLQFAHDARIQVRRKDIRPLTAAERRRIEVDDMDDWLVVEAVRGSRGVPLALAEIYINKVYAGVAENLDGLEGAVQELIERDYDVEITRIEQSVTADVLGAPASRALSAEPSVGALVTLRRYYDANNVLVLASDSIMPGSRFAYSMTYHRER